MYHNPRCGTSRRVLDRLTETGADVTVVDYLAHPPTAGELARLYDAAGLRPSEGLRRKEAAAATLAGADEDAVLSAMAANPVLIERPLVETAKGVRLCRPAERVDEIL